MYDLSAENETMNMQVVDRAVKILGGDVRFP